MTWIFIAVPAFTHYKSAFFLHTSFFKITSFCLLVSWVWILIQFLPRAWIIFLYEYPATQFLWVQSPEVLLSRAEVRLTRHLSLCRSGAAPLHRHRWRVVGCAKWLGTSLLKLGSSCDGGHRPLWRASGHLFHSAHLFLILIPICWRVCQRILLKNQLAPPSAPAPYFTVAFLSS